MDDRSDTQDLLPSWRAGGPRRALLDFLEASTELAPGARVAVFDNDGTLWCEKPAYPQYAFLIEQLHAAVAADPTVAGRGELAALLNGDAAAIAGYGLPRIAMALVELSEGLTPEEFTRRAQEFVHRAVNPLTQRTFAASIYRPMLELLDALRAHGFATFIVSGGGTEFVRAVSQDLYGIPPEGVVGSMIGYTYTPVDGVRTLLRTATLYGDANEGDAKVVNIQQQLGRRPIFAAGNSAGDRSMIEWTTAGSGPTLGLLVDHDDAEREVAYESVAGTFETTENIVDVARANGWVVASMGDDWTTVF